MLRGILVQVLNIFLTTSISERINTFWWNCLIIIHQCWLNRHWWLSLNLMLLLWDFLYMLIFILISHFHVHESVIVSESFELTRLDDRWASNRWTFCLCRLNSWYLGSWLYRYNPPLIWVSVGNSGRRIIVGSLDGAWRPHSLWVGDCWSLIGLHACRSSSFDPQIERLLHLNLNFIAF